MRTSELIAPLAILGGLLVALFVADHFITAHYRRK